MLSIESLVVHEFPDASHPGVAACARGGSPLEAVTAADKRVEIGLHEEGMKKGP
jgi:hypothetical protein